MKWLKVSKKVIKHKNDGKQMKDDDKGRPVLLLFATLH